MQVFFFLPNRVQIQLPGQTLLGHAKTPAGQVFIYKRCDVGNTLKSEQSWTECKETLLNFFQIQLNNLLSSTILPEK